MSGRSASGVQGGRAARSRQLAAGFGDLPEERRDPLAGVRVVVALVCPVLLVLEPGLGFREVGVVDEGLVDDAWDRHVVAHESQGEDGVEECHHASSFLCSGPGP
jgi:hypothetical protein